MSFADEITLTLRAGAGGPGAAQFRRGKHQATGPAVGGNGGPGGSVGIVADRHLTSLEPYRYQRSHYAQNGQPGGRERSQGAAGKDCWLAVPRGTAVYNETETFLGEVLQPGEKLLLARGGRGGLGNAAFKSSTNRSPEQRRPATEGEEKRVRLVLKLLADVGFLGFPSVGKSSLLNRLTGARSRVGTYPFTTVVPELGVWHTPQQSLILADLPGLLEEAHQGRGLGLRFLKHLERCRCLIWVLDGQAEPPLDWKGQWKALQREVKAYNPVLLQRPSLFLINKTEKWPLKESFSWEGKLFFPISVQQQEGLLRVHEWLEAQASHHHTPFSPSFTGDF